jgi:hypothetical protein
MKTSLLFVCALIVCSTNLFAQSPGRYEIGVSYRYQRYSSGMFGFNNIHAESMQPHGIDLNFRYDIGDPKLRGTLVLGWGKIESAHVDYHGLENIFDDCIDHFQLDLTGREQHYLRINPGIEFAVEKGKVSYGYGVGVYVISSFRGPEITTYTDVWSHRDSVTNACIEDSSRMEIVTAMAPGKAVHIAGVSANVFAGYEFYPGITAFASFGINPCYSLRERFFAMAPNASVGVYFRFQRTGGRIGTQ